MACDGECVFQDARAAELQGQIAGVTARLQQEIEEKVKIAMGNESSPYLLMKFCVYFDSWKSSAG